MEKENKIKIVITIVSVGLAIGAKFMNYGVLSIILSVIAFSAVGLSTIADAFKHLIKGKFFDETTLMSIASIGAFVIGEYTEAVLVMALYGIGELFEDLASEKSKKSIETLISDMPDEAIILRDGQELHLKPEDVLVGETVIVPAGGKVPVDGILLSRECFIDLSCLNGESVPKRHEYGDTVLSGSINRSVPIKLRAVNSADNSAAARILELTVSSAEKKAKPERFISAFSKYYTPAVVISAALFAAISVILGRSVSESIYGALIFLVISCPCSLVISVPLAYFCGIGACSREKILVKGSDYLEGLCHAKNILLDKTGTITEGDFKVSGIYPENVTKTELLNIAATAERYSTHPIALSIKKSGEIQGDGEYEEIPGLGIKAVLPVGEVYIGNEKLLDTMNIEYTRYDNGGTTVYVALNGRFIGAITVNDTLKSGAEDIVSLLKKQGVRTVGILSGDNPATVISTGNEIGADFSLGGLTPECKVKKAEELRTSGTTVFVGDGVNDTPVIAAADVSVAMGNLGSKSAIEFADVVLLDDNLFNLVRAIKISKKTHKIALFNIILSVVVKAAIMVLSVTGLANMWAATFADVGVLIIATLNSVRALKN